MHSLLKTIGIRLLWALISATLLICILWAGLHWLIVPRIDEFKPAIQAQASRALGLQVQIGKIQPQGGWWVPWFEINDIVLLDAQGREALRLPRVLAAVSPHSVIQAQFEHLVIERPELDIRKDAQGQIWVAGLNTQVQGDGQGANWFFSQPEFVVTQGLVRWKDETRGGKDAEVLQLSQVDFSMKNPANTHQLRLDFTPAPEWGGRISLRAKFHQLPWHDAGEFASWSGELFADMPQIDVSNLRHWITLDHGLSLQKGRGGLKVWADVSKGAWTGINADIALDEVDVRLGEDLSQLNLRHIKGNLGAKWRGDEVELSSHDLMFETQEGEHWPGGDLRMSWKGQDFNNGTLSADKLDVSALSQISQRLPLPAQLHTALQSLQPKGQIAKLQASWKANAAHSQTPYDYTAKGQLLGFSVTQDRAHAQWRNLPGIDGGDIDFDLNQEGGQAKVRISDGHLTLPQGLEDPVLHFTTAQAQVSWKIHGSDLSLQINNAQLSNAHASGNFSGSWKNGVGAARWPGVVDLSGNFERVEINQVHRYLPEVLPTQLRNYLHEALDQGVASNVKWKLKGDLQNFPFKNKNQGEFKLSATIDNARLVYVPASIASPKQLPWPALTNIHGDLSFEQQAMNFKGELRLQGTQKLVWHKVEANIADLMNTEVVINAQGKGPLSEVTNTVSRSALNEITGGVLEKTQVSGDAEYKLNLKLPIQHLVNTKVSGSVDFSDNDVQLIPSAPVLSHARGVMQFSEQALSFKDLRGIVLGADALIQGNLALSNVGNEAVMPLKITGRLTAEGLRQANELGFISRLALRANGRTAYEARVGIRRGQLELLITSDLKGMSMNLPAPLNKPANTALGLRIETQLTRESLNAQSKVLQDQIKVTVGRVLAVSYLRELSGTKSHVLRGSVALGQAVSENTNSRSNGVALNVQLPSVDLDEWNDIQTNLSGAPLSKALPKNNRLNKYVVTADDGSAAEYLPTQISMQVEQLKVANRNLHQVVAGGTRLGDVWRLNLNAQELSGYAEIRPSANNAPAQLFARLAYLNLPPSAVNDVENMLDDNASPIPALDVVINELTLRGKKLGRLEIDAINRTNANNVREWRLNKFNITVPEASLTANGRWESTGAKNRRTQLDFSMDVRDSGELLARFGTPGAIKSGRGKLTGELSWAGSPMAFDYPSLSGKLNLNIEKGQFLKTEPGAARLLGVLSLQSLPRRLTLDFSDVFSEGFAFDFVRGDVRIDQGVAFTNNLQMKGVSAAAVMEGSADLSRETQDLKVIVAPEISASAYSLYMATINPVIGLTSYLAQLVLSKPLVKATTNEFHIDGTWANPRVTKVN